MAESQPYWASLDTLKVDLSKYQNHLHLLVRMAQGNLKKAESVKALLYLKSDMAREKMKKFFTDFQNHLATFAFKFNQDIDAFVRQKEADLKTRNEGLIKQMQTCEDMISNIGSVLADESKCRSIGADIATKCMGLFNSGFDCVDADDFHYLDFVPLIQCFLEPEEIGYIKCCDVDLERFNVMSDVIEDSLMKAEVNANESLLIRTNQRHYEELLNYLTVRIVDPAGQLVKTAVEGGKNGVYLVNYLPLVTGIHDLHVRVFNVDIKGSPFQINVVKKAVCSSTSTVTGNHNLMLTNDLMPPLVDIRRDLAPTEVPDFGSAIPLLDSSVLMKVKPDERTYQEDNCNSNNSWGISSRFAHPWNFQGCVTNGLTESQGHVSVGSFQESAESQKASETEMIWSDIPCKGSAQNEKSSDSLYPETVALSKLELKSEDCKIWNNDDQNLSVPSQEMGCREEGANSAAISILSEYVKLGLKKVRIEFVRKVGAAGDKNNCLSFPIGVTVNHVGDIIACDTRHHAIKIFNAGGDFLLAIRGERRDNFCRPSAVVVNNRNEIFVKDDRCINVFDNEGNFVREIGVGRLDRPYGLAFNKEGHLIVFNQSHKHPNICLFSQDGQFLERSPFKPLLDLGAMNGSKCRFIECVEDNVYVVDLGKSVVYVVDQLGNTVNQFGGYGREFGQFNEPSGITKDPSGILLIADSRNNRIQVFTADGVCHGYLDSGREIVRPSDIHLSDDGFLYVSNYLHHCIKVFRILPPD